MHHSAAIAVVSTSGHGAKRHIETLELAFLGTGYWQHVFTRAEDDDGDWVYKIPAAFGYLLPYRYSFQVFWPATRYERALQFWFASVPSGLDHRICLRLADHLRRVSPQRLQGVSKLIEHASRPVTRGGERLLASHCRRARLQGFVRMLDQMEYLARRSLDDILLPYQIHRRQKAILHVNGRTHTYHGPMLVQRKACLFEAGEKLTTFDWNDLVGAQHRLWRNGIAFGCLREILGPQSWGLYDGRLRLCDTSGFTTERHAARTQLTDENLDLGEQRAREQLNRLGAIEGADKYFRFVRGQINQRTFDHLWRTELDGHG